MLAEVRKIRKQELIRLQTIRTLFRKARLIEMTNFIEINIGDIRRSLKVKNKEE